MHLARLKSLFCLSHGRSPPLWDSKLRVKARTKHFCMSCQRCHFILQRSKWLSKLSFSVATVTSTERRSLYKFVSLDVEEAGKEHFLNGREFFRSSLLVLYFGSIRTFLWVSWNSGRIQVHCKYHQISGDSDLPHTNKAIAFRCNLALG